ncbi:potassium/proton antiporter [Dysgonomonas sp. 216]|uniref:potassium/proton antiporter n=1 Tax=Dysgonomonas sp. 216 TaxID=2302934 RepID=UPI0013D0D118|nr:potassium/proton antiporter [Dysgonomonas sp. 216]NDW19740.1 potassium/proton antiporter [Dysgonomonas sp. 216]
MEVQTALFILALLFFISIWIGKIGSKFGVPALLLFLGIGMIFGSDGLGLIIFSNLKEAEAIGTIALCIILFSGGLNTKFSEIKPVISQSIVLATFGVLITALITGAFSWWLTGLMMPSLALGFTSALLFASCMSSTDSAAVFALLRSKGLRLKNNLTPTLELESGSNDPMAYILTITLISVIKDGGDINILSAISNIVIQLVVGSLAGYLLGKLAVFVMDKIKIDNEAYYPILLFTFCIFIFSATGFIQGNGFLAVYIGGLIIGNAKFVNKRSSVKFFDGLTWLAQIFMFLILGLLVNPKELLPIAAIGLIIGLFMILIARPLTVFLCLAPFRKIGLKDKIFISWVGLRGAVPIIFAIYPLTADVPHAHFIFNVVFFITLVSLLIQGTLLTRVAQWLDLSLVTRPVGRLKHFDLELSEDMGSVISEITLNKQAIENGRRLMDLPLPDQSLVVMVRRDDDYFIPKGKTELMVGDKLLIIADEEKTLKETYKSLCVKNIARIKK